MGGEDRSGVILARLIQGNLDIAEYYAKRGKLIDVDVDANNGGDTALTLASKYGNVEIVKVLLAAGADQHKADDDGWTPLMRAAYGGHMEVVQVLLAAGADKDKADNHGRTPLMFARSSGFDMIVSLLSRTE